MRTCLAVPYPYANLYPNACLTRVQTERNELSRSFLSICRVLKQKAVDNQRLEAEIIKLRSAMGLAQVGSSVNALFAFMRCSCNCATHLWVRRADYASFVEAGSCQR